MKGKTARAAIFLPLLLLLLTLPLLAGACGEETPEVPAAGAEGQQGGKVAPDFAGQTLSGQEVSLSSYRGKPLFLIFWATW